MRLESMLVPLEIHGTAGVMAPAVEEIVRPGVGRAGMPYCPQSVTAGFQLTAPPRHGEAP